MHLFTKSPKSGVLRHLFSAHPPLQSGMKCAYSGAGFRGGSVLQWPIIGRPRRGLRDLKLNQWMSICIRVSVELSLCTSQTMQWSDGDIYTTRITDPTFAPRRRKLFQNISKLDMVCYLVYDQSVWNLNWTTFLWNAGRCYKTGHSFASRVTSYSTEYADTMRHRWIVN